ncbi:MAG: hypothetical protein ACHRXM_35585, partial [Isosphaerales bacterium]
TARAVGLAAPRRGSTHPTARFRARLSPTRDARTAQRSDGGRIYCLLPTAYCLLTTNHYYLVHRLFK